MLYFVMPSEAKSAHLSCNFLIKKFNIISCIFKNPAFLRGVD